MNLFDKFNIEKVNPECSNVAMVQLCRPSFRAIKIFRIEVVKDIVSAYTMTGNSFTRLKEVFDIKGKGSAGSKLWILNVD